MFNMFSKLTYLDILYAALTSFVITHLIINLNKLRRNIYRNRVKPDLHDDIQRLAVIRQCRSMFPLSTVNFRGKVFTMGMKVRITTLQQKIIEGEIIGKNDKDILCIITGEHIIAHEMNKIEDITELA